MTHLPELRTERNMKMAHVPLNPAHEIKQKECANLCKMSQFSHRPLLWDFLREMHKDSRTIFRHQIPLFALHGFAFLPLRSVLLSASLAITASLRHVQRTNESSNGHDKRVFQCALTPLGLKCAQETMDK